MNTRRLGRIFRPDGRALIVAMDHSAILGPSKGLERPGETIAQVVAGGADAVMTSFGIAKQFARALSPVGLILRADGAPTKLGPDVAAPVWFGVEVALRLGADALCISAFPGTELETPTLESLATVCREAQGWGLAVQAEIVPGGMRENSGMRTLENVALSARLGAELGADWVKVPYVAGFEHVTGTCYKPVVILGGSKRGGPAEMLAEVRAALDSGAAGVTIGRNIFEADNPRAMVAALSALIHDDASVDEALAVLRQG